MAVLIIHFQEGQAGKQKDVSPLLNFMYIYSLLPSHQMYSNKQAEWSRSKNAPLSAPCPTVSLNNWAGGEKEEVAALIEVSPAGVQFTNASGAGLDPGFSDVS